MASLAGTATRLAVDGGDSIVPDGYMMLSRWPRIEPADLDRVLDQLRSGLLTEMADAHLVHEFEIEAALLTGTRYALTTNSGTAALHCALAAVGVESGDEVIVPALAYIACAAAAIHQQAIPIFADVDPDTYNLTAGLVEAAIGERTRAVIVVHLHGLPADVAEIRAVASRRDVAVIEDFSQAVGASIGGAPVGGIGQVGAASLMAGKNLPAGGEGGVLVTDELELRNRAARLKCFGEELHPDGSYRLLHETFGWNYRISLLPLVLARAQLGRLADYNEQRQAGARDLDAAIGQIPGFTPPTAPPGFEHVYHMYRFQFDPEEAGLSISLDQMRLGLRQAFWAEGLPLVEFQNVPLPGHPLLKTKVGYGRGCPWTCHQREELEYRIGDYPGALAAIQRSLVVGVPSQATLCNPEVLGHYVRCFEKLAGNLRAFERFAAALPSAPPWAEEARLF
jgi:perosamine synthetase